MLVFKAYDRAQDRPHTLVWLLTRLAGGYVVILGLYMYLQNRGSGTLPPGAERAILIPVVVNVFGDGLAEPIGIAFGRHKYRARALWYKGRCCAGEFKRTLEGSAVVYFVTLLAVIPCRTKVRPRISQIPPPCFISQLVTVCPYIAIYTTDTFRTKKSPSPSFRFPNTLPPWRCCRRC
jgi:hypothetical protein